MNKDLNVLIDITGCRELVDKLDVVKKNRDFLSTEELNGKYKNSYTKLKLEVKSLLESFVKWHIAGSYMWGMSEENKKKVIAYTPECLSLIDNKKLWNKCWNELDIEGIIDTLAAARDKMSEYYYSNQLCWLEPLIVA